MKRILVYISLIYVFLTACEDIYNPEIDQVSHVLTIDARIIYEADKNYIRLAQSLGFNDKSKKYPPVKGASVSMTDSRDTAYNLTETSDGIFRLDFQLNPELEYKLRVNLDGEVFESTFEKVPEWPRIDSLYGLEEIKIIQAPEETNVDNFRKSAGLQLYANMNNENETHYYRFTARKTYLYVYFTEVMVFGEIEEVPVFAWNTIATQGTFNIAAPPEYSTSTLIRKHPLYFMEQKAGVKQGEMFTGWILFLHQYSLSKSSFNYYKDLNNQLESEGRLFDPLYVQARSNIQCITTPGRIVLGNFEISSHRERRYYINYLGEKNGYLIKSIPYFYEIPESGEQQELPPDFWEYPNKQYPDE